MSEVSFYRQERKDRGVRTGLGINDTTILHRFEPGSEDTDPALVWYIDLNFRGANLPVEPEPAREWLIEHRRPIEAALTSAAEELQIGLDADDTWPFRRAIRGLPRGVAGQLAVSSVRSVQEGELARKILGLARRWQAILNNLETIATTRGSDG